MKIKGLHTYRFQDNPEEKAFAEAWEEQHLGNGRHLGYLLSKTQDPEVPSFRDELVAATVIQWLGSPVGQIFLRNLGYEKRHKNDEDDWGARPRQPREKEESEKVKP
jgi:hypothetical protein